MKKLVLILSVFLSGINLINAQLPVTISYDGNDITNSTTTLVRDVSMFIEVTNNGASDLNLILEVISITTPHKAPSWQVCWGDCIIVSTPIVFPSPLTIPAGTTNSSSFDVHYVSDGNTDPANIAFHIYEEGNSADYISLVLDTEYVGIKTALKNRQFNIFPNPANGIFTITFDENSSDSELIFSNILGKIIKKVRVNNNKIQFNTNEFSKGMYFVSLIKNNNILLTKKMVIN